MYVLFGIIIIDNNSNFGLKNRKKNIGYILKINFWKIVLIYQRQENLFFEFLDYIFTINLDYKY